VVVRSHRAQTALFVGDSHIQQYWPRVRYVVQANPDSARSAEFATYIGCPPLPGVNVLERNSYCDQFFEYALQAAWRSDVDTVVFGAFWEAYFLGEFTSDRLRHPLYSVADGQRTPLQLDSPGTRRAFAELGADLGRLVASGRRVFIVLSNPTSPRFDPTTLLQGESRWGLRGAIALPASRRMDPRAWENFVAPLHAELRRIAADAGAQILDPRDTLCDGSECAATAADGAPLYKDTNHLRPFFALAHANFIDQVLVPSSEP
jgi:SGNH domain (fused to AT3 domains)